MTALGTVKGKIDVSYLQTDIYDGARNARIILEALYISFVAYYFIQEIMQWLDKEA